ncbi:phospholipid-binding lipoprotein MlaA [Maridesulfovibrio ferrireducens]|uniref:Phospholipid-binding lipoprotein MlaA n=1 Tax=Maridesulfovibrio ferrireducens TaxID=246191 RepID=A0A1G9FRK8_9BACT|nr:VacJ family lipoprotein [Maridesulfovibrio ferrireducens]SDK91029.1 phospholipid-binding lipoprotein MlaA [Maridesulfovibrio ferrireducens]
MMNTTIKYVMVLCLFLLIPSCATIKKEAPDMTLPPTGFMTPVSHAPTPTNIMRKEADLEFLDVYDPWDAMNRNIYSFNAQFDRAIYIPAVNIYTTVLPKPVRKGVTNAVNNLNEVNVILNSSLQGRGEKVLRSFYRLLLNSTFGILGIMDVADDWGIKRVVTSTADTLGVWGMGPGPYVVLPLFGPSSVRDSAGLAGDSALLWVQMNYVYDILGVKEGRTLIGAGEATIRGLNLRSKVPFRYYQTGSPFEYDLVRFLYSTKRELDIEKQ